MWNVFESLILLSNVNQHSKKQKAHVTLSPTPPAPSVTYYLSGPWQQSIFCSGSLCQMMWKTLLISHSRRKLNFFSSFLPLFSSFLFPNLFAVLRFRGTRSSIRPESTEDPEFRLVYAALVRPISSRGIGSPQPENFYGPRLILFPQSLTYLERYGWCRKVSLSMRWSKKLRFEFRSQSYQTFLLLVSTQLRFTLQVPILFLFVTNVQS